MKSSEYLIAAKAVIADPANHLQNGGYAVDKHGNIILGNYPEACKFCSVGALQKVTGIGDGAGGNRDAYGYLKAAIPGMEITMYNDIATHSQVMAMFDKAIAQALSQND